MSHRRKASRQQFAPRIGILRPDGQRAGGDVDLRFGGVNRGFETLLPSLDGEREARAGLDLVGIAFGNEKVDLQGRNLRELGHHDAGRGVGAFADVAQADHAVERRSQLRERDVRLHDVDVGVEHRQFRAGLFVGLLAHGVLFEQGALAVNAVFGQFELRLVTRELGHERQVVDLGQQLALADDGALLEVDRHDFARGFEREVHLLVRQQVAHRGDAVGEPLRTDDASVDVEGALSAGRDRRFGGVIRCRSFVVQ